MKKWKIYCIFSLVVIALILSFFVYFKISTKKEVSLLSDTIEEKVSKILEISTVQYNYTNVVTYKDNKKMNGFNMPFTSKSFIIKYKGYINAGVDLNKVETQVIGTQSVKITLEKPVIFDNVIIEEEVYVYDERDSVFNKLSFEDLYDVLVKEKENMEKEVIEQGLLNDAQKNTKELLTSLLQGVGFENIEIIFK